MKCEDINIRDPFVFVHNDMDYLYGTRGETAFYGEALAHSDNDDIHGKWEML